MKSLCLALLPIVLISRLSGKEPANCSCEMLLSKDQKSILFGNPDDGSLGSRASKVGVLKWTNGRIPFRFADDVPEIKRQLFMDAAAEVSSVAGITWVPRNFQTSFVQINDLPGLSGGNASLGRPSDGKAEINIGSDSWTRFVLAHEIGHLLGLIHEHQRSDRDQFIEVVCANVEGDGVCTNPSILGRLTNSIQTGKPYDFDSRMHYFDTAYSKDSATLKTMIPRAGFEKFANRMGTNHSNIWTAWDRFAMTTILGYGLPAIPLGPVVTNTQDSGSGSLRAALYYAHDHPGTRIRFQIPKSDPGYENGVFRIRTSASLYASGSGTVVDGNEQTAFTGNTNPNGPEIVICPRPGIPESVKFEGLIFRETNARVSGVSISGFGYNGVLIDGVEATGNEIESCLLGMNPAGAAAEPNLYAGVRISGGAEGNAVRNSVISGNARWGINVDGSSDNRIEGSIIGLDASGINAVPNQVGGVVFWNGSNGNRLGGDSPGTGNTVSGNASVGLWVLGQHSDDNVVMRNSIGVNKAGVPRGNATGGIVVEAGPKGTVIGGPAVGGGNVIGGSPTSGITVKGGESQSIASGTLIAGNQIGTDLAGAALGNSGVGIRLLAGSSGTTIGGLAPGEGNVIRNNAGGIYLSGTGNQGNTISGNAIHGNTGDAIGIADGANAATGRPVISAAMLSGDLLVTGSVTLPSQVANAAVRIEFFATTLASPTGQPVGERFIGTTQVVTNASGTASFSASLPVRTVKGRVITATATVLASGSTSRFSDGVQVTMTDTDGDGMPDAWELANGLSATNPADSVQDLDRDGFSNRDEYFFGSPVQSGQGCPRLTMERTAPGMLALRVENIRSIPLHIETSSTLSGGSWRPLTVPLYYSGSGPLVTLSAGELGRRFFRVSTW